MAAAVPAHPPNRSRSNALAASWSWSLARPDRPVPSARDSSCSVTRPAEPGPADRGGRRACWPPPAPDRRPPRLLPTARSASTLRSSARSHRAASTGGRGRSSARGGPPSAGPGADPSFRRPAPLRARLPQLFGPRGSGGPEAGSLRPPPLPDAAEPRSPAPVRRGGRPDRFRPAPPADPPDARPLDASRPAPDEPRRGGGGTAPFRFFPPVRRFGGAAMSRIVPGCRDRRAKTKRWTPLVRGPRQSEIRRRPTLPGGLPPSTIGAGGLNFRVRDGNGCDPAAMATEICCQG